MNNSATRTLPLFSAGGEVGARMAARDWSAFPLGDPALWPQSLKTILNLTLTSKGATFFCWGPELHFFYNDAYLEMLGTKHPAALGQAFKDVWPEVWSEILPLVRETLAGASLHHENMPFSIIRNGRNEEVSVTFSYSPLYDDNGDVAGLFCALTETTGAVATAQANAKFHTFFEQGSYFAGVMTLDGTLIEVNRLSLETSGFTKEEVIGKKFWDCGWWNRSPDLAERIRAGAMQAARGEKFKIETPYFIADGSERITELILSPVTDEAGRVIFIAPTGSDITQRKQTEVRLRLLDQMNQATRNAFDPKAIMEVLTRLLGQHLHATRCAYADLEADSDQFTIRSDWTFGDAMSTVGVYSLNLFGQRAASDLREGHTLVVRDVDHELAPADGADMFNAIGIKAIICCPLVKEGKLIAMMAVHQQEARDWTPQDIALVEEVVQRSWAHIERVRAVEVLKKSESHLLSLFDQTAAGIAEADLEGRLVRVNNRYCEILGRDRQDLVGRKMDDLAHPDDRGSELPLLSTMLATGRSSTLEVRYLHPAGSVTWVSTTVNLIRSGPDSKPESMLAVALDITERKEAEDRLKEADRRKDEFLAMLAHELRNPLAPISTAADLLRVAGSNERIIKQSSEVITRQVRHMTELVDDLLDVSRVTRGLVALESADVDIKAVLGSAIEQVRPLIESRKHQITTRVASAPAHVFGDRTRLVQVVSNLLNNACKYTPPGGEITLALDVDGENKEVRISVTDNGSGIEATLLPRIFDLFAQGERTPDRAQGGLGLGLALVKSIMTLHGGRIEVRSEGPGRGSVFTASLPLLKLVPTQLPEPAETAAPQKSARPRRLMVVDDNLDAARLIALLLEAQGHDVTVMEDAYGALTEAERNPPEVFILDIGLPGMDGYELARRLRARPETANTLLIALSGYGQHHDKVLSKSAGFDHHCVKPVSADVLHALLSGTAAKNSL